MFRAPPWVPQHPPPCVLSALRKCLVLAWLDVTCSVRLLGGCVPGVGTGITPWCGSSAALLKAREAYGKEERGGQVKWKAMVWQLWSWKVPSHLAPSPCLSFPMSRAGSAGNPRPLWEFGMHESLCASPSSWVQAPCPTWGKDTTVGVTHLCTLPPTSPSSCLCKGEQSRPVTPAPPSNPPTPGQGMP